MTWTPRDAGWIEVICGSMFSGKTEELIRRVRRAEIAKLKTVIVKPTVDDRFSSKHIVSHNKNKIGSITLENVNDIYDLAKDADVVAIDEAQFFGDELVDVCKTLSKQKKRVVVAGLDTDYRGLPFGPMPDIMCEADYLDKLRAICVKCGNPATYTQRLSDDQEQVVIGETNIYEARCRNCYQPPRTS
jgi:thymidine kinase